MEQALIRLADLSKYYTSGQNVVMGLNHLDLTFHRGEFVAITGESGSGKSTLSHVLGGIIPYESGEFYFDGQPTSHYDSLDWERYRRDHISFISQNYGILPGATVLSNVVTALRLSGMETRCAFPLPNWRQNTICKNKKGAEIRSLLLYSVSPPHAGWQHPGR